ncbi:uncharacterized protein K452DRAFT_97673 [Aplosporella prunicola CBS 121167]|uniref:Uncharacterized protein n=1 Tax=Aplosporella prunicola CBS 121167 TaxID=1176127 RepID=A0A6A6B293_9PEZI|nr:uncharacterized protein K452DRAFT_97673 [Aplosporella prunicola CBS 121167]KAF2137708.1 hypothetical protein K452DRAFT_97673 [Aplosporella prunicola CBS 121167]
MLASILGSCSMGSLDLRRAVYALRRGRVVKTERNWVYIKRGFAACLDTGPAPHTHTHIHLRIHRTNSQHSTQKRFHPATSPTMHAFATLSALALTLLASPTSAQAGPESLELTGMRLRVPSTRSYPWQTVAIGVQDNAQANGAPSVGTTCVATWDVGGEGWPHGYVRA